MNEQRNTILLNSKQYVHIQDSSDGRVYIYKGPGKCTLQDDDKIVLYNPDNGQFESIKSGNNIIQHNVYAREGEYVKLLNRVVDGDARRYPVKGQQDSPELAVGTDEIIIGPLSFSLWPGQFAEVINGHRLSTNEFLLVKVNNGKVAEENWDKCIIEYLLKEDETLEQVKEAIRSKISFLTGEYIIIKGTQIAYFIPCNGVEVIPVSNENFKPCYIRQAVTLKQLEYCVLLDQDGTKEYIYGPKVVFPKPTQTFYIKDKKTIFKAIELDKKWGVHIKVIESYEEDDISYKEGDELFFTGESTKIYWPRREHTYITYGDAENIIHYGIAIPEGDSRYVLNRETGVTRIEEGPKIFLPDPRKEVIIKRILKPNLVKLLYPTNDEAITYNIKLQEEKESRKNDNDGEDYLMTRTLCSSTKDTESLNDILYTSSNNDDKDIISMNLSRKVNYTPPRSITLNKSKFDGAVTVTVWPNFAIRIINKADSSKSRVIIGEQTVKLEYCETLDILELSTGTPKTNAMVKEDVYLQISGNLVSDIIEEITTIDGVQITLPVKYEVNFLPEFKDKWFVLKNYVGYLTDHMRSKISNVVKTAKFDYFLNNYVDILNEALLDNCIFTENGMSVSNIIYKELFIIDNNIRKLYENKRFEIVSKTLELKNNIQTLEIDTQKKELECKLLSLRTALKEEQVAFSIKNIELDTIHKTKQHELNMLNYNNLLQTNEKEEENHNLTHKFELQRKNEKEKQSIEVMKEKMQVEKEALLAETAALIDKAQAINPQLSQVLNDFSKTQLMDSLSQNMANLSVLEGSSLVMTLKHLIQGSGLDGVLNRLITKKEE